MSEAPFWQRAIRYAANHWGFWGMYALIATLLLALYVFNVPVAEIVVDMVRGWFGR